MRRFLVGLLAVIGVLTILVVGGGAAAVWWIVRDARQTSAVPDKTILRLAIHGAPTETGAASSTVRRLLGGERATALRDVINALDQAGTDKRVLGLVVDLSDARPSLAAAQELRDAVMRFRDTGKLAFAFADSFGEAGRSTQSYYLATAFDEIWVQPAGEIGVTGFALDNPFVADTLKMLGVAPRFDQRHEFKGGINSFIDKAYPAPLKAQLQALLDDLLDQLVEGIAAGRKLAPAAVRLLIDQAPLFANEAQKAGLIDSIGYADEVTAQIRRKTDGTAKFIALDAYLGEVGSPHRAGEKIALIYGVGAVMRGGDDDDGLTGGESLKSEAVAKAFRLAAADPKVRAILFRVDSPGGSYVASDTVWREVKRAREAGKPVVASMGTVAASGGYFVAMAADKVIADPGTLTGSIGVFSGKFVLTGLWDKIGVSWDQVTAGANAGMESMNRDFTPAQWARFEASLDRVYADFTQRVSDDRKIPLPRLDLLARGRVWTGRQAVANGLADAAGGFNDALAAAKALARLAPEQPIQLELFPPERSPLDRVIQLMGELDRTATALRLTAQLGALMAPVLQRVEQAVRAETLTAPVEMR